MSTVAITQNKQSIEKAIHEALQHLDIESMVKDKIVAIKPNETWASPQDISGVTHGDTLRGVIQYIKKLQPKKLIVSGGAGAAETEDVMRYSGMIEVIEAEGVEFFDHNRGPFEEIELEYSDDPDVQGPQKSIRINPHILEYETLIALNQLKLHSTATVTLAMKNIAMSFPAADYYGHPRGSQTGHTHHFFDDMHSFIVAMVKRFPIHLAITVGHPAMIATGPLGGHAVETGMVIASTDAIAADTVGAQLLGFSSQAVRHIWEAGKIGLGEIDIDAIKFPAMSMKEAIGAFTEAAYGERLTFDHA